MPDQPVFRVRRDPPDDVFDSDSGRPLRLEAGHLNSCDAAWSNMLKRHQAFTRYIQGKPVHADPASDADSDTGDLPVADPDAGEPSAHGRFDSERGARVSDEGFQLPQILVKILPALAQVENGIADQLSGAVIRCLPPAVRDVNRVRKRF